MCLKVFFFQLAICNTKSTNIICTFVWMFKQFIGAIKAYGKAINFVFSNNLWIYFIYPIVISALLIFVAFTFSSIIQDKIDLMVGTIGSGAIYEAIHSVLSFFLKIVLGLILSIFGKYALLILMSPIMALLSAKTEEIITGKKFPFDSSQFMKDILRGILIVLRNMLIQLGITILCFTLIWIPLVGWFVSIFLFIISYYFYGFSMIDYVSERRKLNISKSASFVRKNKGMAMGNGFMFTLIFAIPYVGGVFASVLAPIAACISVLETEKNYVK